MRFRLYYFLFAMAVKHMRGRRAPDKPFPNDVFHDYEKRVSGLTPFEATIFQCYLNGMDAKAIMSKLFITKNAIKAHNEHIYAKVGVAGKEAFMLYIELIKMNGLADRLV